MMVGVADAFKLSCRNRAFRLGNRHLYRVAYEDRAALRESERSRAASSSTTVLRISNVVRVASTDLGEVTKPSSPADAPHRVHASTRNASARDIEREPRA